jgi:hypothetical protein
MARGKMQLRTRLWVMAAALAAWMLPGTTTLAHGGGHEGRGAPPERGQERADHRAHRPGERFYLELSGSQVNGGGDPDGRGSAILHLDPEKEVVCLETRWMDIDGDVTDLHIHHAPPGQDGPHHIDVLKDERLAGRWNEVGLCVRVKGEHQGHGESHVHAQDHGGGPHGGAEPADRIQQIVDRPGDFYLAIHSTAYPVGAIRGQIGH